MAWLIEPSLPAASYPRASRAGLSLAGRHRHARPRPSRHERMGLSALAPALLPGRPAGPRLAAVLRAPLPERRAEQLLLPAADEDGLPGLARPGRRRVRVRGQGEPLPDPPEAPESARAAARSLPAP